MPTTPSTHAHGQKQLLVWLQYLLLLAVFGVGFLGYLMPTLGWGKMIPGDLGDARFNSVILEHLYQWVTGVAPKLWSPQFFYPFEGVLAFSDNHFGSAWSYILARLLGLTRENAFQVWFGVGTCLNFWVCWVVLKRLGFSVIAAAAGAFVFAFALPALHTEGHAQLVYRFAVPLAFESWYRTISKGQLRGFFQTGFWCGIQFLCSIYLGIFLVYLLVATSIAYLICLLILKCVPKVKSSLPQQIAEREPLPIPAQQKLGLLDLVLTIIALGLTLGMLLKYQHVATDYQIVRALVEVKSMLPRFGSYLLADSSGLTNWIGAHIKDVPMRHEQQMFVGVGVSVLALFGLIRSVLGLFKPQQLRNLCIVTLLAVLSLTLLVFTTVTINEKSFYLLLVKLPGVGSIRAVSRIVLIMLLPVGVMAAMGIDSVARSRLPQGIKAVYILLLLLGLTVETVYYKHYHAPILESWGGRQRNIEAIFAKEPLLGNDSILLINQASQDTFFLTEIDAMIYAQDRHLKTLNGYSGNTPPGYTYPDPCLPSDTRVNSFFAFVDPSEAKRQQILDNLRTISPQPCLKPPESNSTVEQK